MISDYLIPNGENMDAHRFFVEKLRFHLKEEDTLVFVGWFFDGSTRYHALSAQLDGTELPLEISVNKGFEIRQKYIGMFNEILEEVIGVIQLPANWKEGKELTIFSSYHGEQSKAYGMSVKKLSKAELEFDYYIENCHREENTVTVAGWCASHEEIRLILLDGLEKELPVKIERYYRKDLEHIFPDAEKDAKQGFLVKSELPKGARGPFFLEMRGAVKYSKVRLNKWDEGTKIQFLCEKASDAFRYFQRNGISATLYKISAKLGKKEKNSYDAWRKKYTVTADELKRQTKENFSYKPVFSIVVPLYETKPEYLREMIDSILAQTYPHWELCLVDGSPMKTALTAILEQYAKKDRRICYQTLGQNAGISGNTNAALKMATGDFIVPVDHDDVLPPNALYEFAAAVNQDREIDVLYSDEDKISMDGKKYFEPHFKSDFNIDLLCSVNYICHLFSVHRNIVQTIGEFDSSFDGAQDYDFILRCCEVAKKIHHVPKILYHWRCHVHSTAANPESKLYAFEAGRRAIEAHYNRCNIPAHVENTRFYGMYHTVYHWDEEPLVSIVIPNKDHSEDLAKCVNSILEKSDYRNFEIIVVENNSTVQETFAYYKKLEQEHDNVHVVYYEGGFNYSKINNFGVKAAKGEYFLLLNNDTEMIHGNCIREMLGYCMRGDVGIVGAKLLYEDDTIQHAGAVIGFGGIAGHTFIGKPRYEPGYFGRILCAQNYSAVTAACLLTKRSVYEEVGGLTEELAVAFNDIDYCLKVRASGKLVVYNPYAELYHYESKSRGYEDSPEKVERFNGEIEKLKSRWGELMEQGDPYYNPNLTLNNSDFSLHK